MTDYLDALREQREFVRGRLRGMPIEKQAAFAAAAAEEVLPVYVAYAEEARSSGDATLMREAVDAAWDIALGGPKEAFAAVALRQRCLDATPHTDDAESVLDEAGSDAGLVVVAAVRAASGDEEGGGDAAAGVVSLLDNVLDADDDSDEIPKPIKLELERQRAALALLEANEVDAEALRRLGRPQALAKAVDAARPN